MTKKKTEDEQKPDFEVVEKKPKSTKRKAGRPRKLYDYKMQNGSISAEDIFLYVPISSLPEGQVDRFLKMTDKLITELGPKAVSETDVKDIASLYRDTLHRDSSYETLSDCAGVPDKTTMLDIEKLSKQIHEYQKSLKTRAADREAERKNNKDLSMIDIVDKFIYDEGLFALFEAQNKALLDSYYANPHTDVDEYMTLHTATSEPSVKRIEKKDD
jgi:hypothetical protein